METPKPFKESLQSNKTGYKERRHLPHLMPRNMRNVICLLPADADFAVHISSLWQDDDHDPSFALKHSITSIAGNDASGYALHSSGTYAGRSLFARRLVPILGISYWVSDHLICLFHLIRIRGLIRYQHPSLHSQSPLAWRSGPSTLLSKTKVQRKSPQ